MITSNADAEFTTKTTIIVVLARLQWENTAFLLAQTVVLQCSKGPEFCADSREPKSQNRIGAFAKIRKYENGAHS
jgi:hypothetical protein